VTLAMMTIEQQLEDAIRTMLAKRADGAPISHVEAARRVGGPRWRSLDAPARRAAQRLSQSGEIVVSQKGSTVDALTAKGPLHIRRTI
jgi:hypothetical protein